MGWVHLVNMLYEKAGHGSSMCRREDHIPQCAQYLYFLNKHTKHL